MIFSQILEKIINPTAFIKRSFHIIFLLIVLSHLQFEKYENRWYVQNKWRTKPTTLLIENKILWILICSWMFGNEIELRSTKWNRKVQIRQNDSACVIGHIERWVKQKQSQSFTISNIFLSNTSSALYKACTTLGVMNEKCESPNSNKHEIRNRIVWIMNTKMRKQPNSNLDAIKLMITIERSNYLPMEPKSTCLIVNGAHELMVQAYSDVLFVI